MSYKIGDRVRLVRFDNLLDDSWDVPLQTCGQVMKGPDREGDLQVDWDNGVKDLYVNPSSVEPEHPCPASPTAAELGALIEGFAQLGPKARKLLSALTSRLVKGAKEHGDFEGAAARDWNREAAEEDLDACVYRTLGIMQKAGML